MALVLVSGFVFSAPLVIPVVAGQAGVDGQGVRIAHAVVRGVAEDMGNTGSGRRGRSGWPRYREDRS